MLNDLPRSGRAGLFSARTEYACVAMLELAARHHEPEPVRLKSISEKHQISHRFLVQILLQLKTAGLVQSVRGAAGGYQLAREPDSITIADIVNVIDPNELYPQQPEMSPLMQTMQTLWNEVMVAQYELLRKMSLSALVQRAQAEFTYQI